MLLLKLNLTRKSKPLEQTMVWNFICFCMLQKVSFIKITCVYTRQQNGIVERKCQNLLNIGRALKIQSCISLSYWGYCLKHAAHLINVTPSLLLHHKTPYEILYSKKPIYSSLKVFECLLMLVPALITVEKSLIQGADNTFACLK